ncbi:DUF2142 domain-containing protein [Actinospongicola halichondriae]|uniref:DUF2142 domain-containing protein n=1 Tax=Actinospongicola halichondriae TaxID=3236844 RepID=UPI003D3E3CCC
MRLANERRRWWALFALLGMATTAWALASPLMAGHDESSHVVRAAAVARGHGFGRPAPDAFPPEPNVFIEVPAPEAYALAKRVGCFNKRRDVTPDCAPSFAGGHDVDWVLTYQFRSQPAYYAAVGWTSLIDPAADGVYAMRVVSGLLCAALLASAFTSARVGAHPRWTVLGVAVALTPEALYLAGSVNSNAVEVAAAVGVWAALLALTRVDGPAPARLVTRAGVAMVVLVGTRGLSPLFGAMIVALVALLLGRDRSVDLLRRRDVRWWAVAVAGTAVTSLAYVEWVRRQLPIERAGQGLGTAVDQLGWYLRQGVGIFGSNDIPLPWPVYAIWALALLCVVVAAVSRFDGRGSLVLAATVAAGIGIQIGAEGFSLPPIGFFWQGRYALPLLVGVPMVATTVVATATGPARVRLDRVALVTGPLAALTVAGHLLGFLQAARRFAVTLDGPANPLEWMGEQRWTPPPGPILVWTVVFLVGIGAATAVALLPGPRVQVSSTSTSTDTGPPSSGA